MFRFLFLFFHLYPCSSGTVEQEFSASSQTVNQRRSHLAPSSVNTILFLRSIKNNKLCRDHTMPIVTGIDDGKDFKRPIYIEVHQKTMDQRNNLNVYSSKRPILKSLNSSSIVKDNKSSHSSEIPTNTKWSTRKKVLMSLLIALIVCIIIAAIILSVVLTKKTATSTTATTSSTTIISAYWTFDNVVTDLYGVYNGNLVSGASYSPVSTTQPYLGNGRALSLSSTSNQFFVVSTPFLNLGYTSFTIEAWIYSVTGYTGDNSIFGQCQCSTCANECLYFIVRGGCLYGGFTFNDVSGSSTLTTSLWYHIAFVYNYEIQQQIVYLNGIQDGIKSNAGSYQGINGTIQIGMANASLAPNYFNGYIDNVKVTTRAKSAAEILNDASLIAYYSFDLPSPNLDNGPNGLNGASVNTATVLGRVNQAMRFTGSSSYFQAYGFYQEGYGVYMNKPFSFSMWINPSSTASSTFVQQSTTQTTGGLCMNMIGFYSASSLAGQLTAQTYGFPTIYGPYITINTWTHFAWTYSPANGYTLYVNGIYFGSTGAYTLLASGAITWLQIGFNFVCTAGNIYNAGYQGSIDEIYIYNRELTQTDVTALANP